MKILEHGTHVEKEDGVEKFACSECGCIFKAEQGEYYVDYGTNGYHFSSVTVSSCTIPMTVTDTYACSCPECHKIVTKEKKRETNTYTWTVSNGASNITTKLDDNVANAESLQVKGE